MGPRSIDRGIGRVTKTDDATNLASMGPRSIDRGIPNEPAANKEHYRASMGPRSIDRGISWGFYRRVFHVGLQWGRDQLIAEFEHRSEDTMPHSWLQWGRDQLIAEFRS